jgi:D-3-phosphoglycerate dehydrogenase
MFGTLKNQIDIPTSVSMGIPIFTSPYQHQTAVAELVISFIVLLARQMGDRSMEIHQGNWQKVHFK